MKSFAWARRMAFSKEHWQDEDGNFFRYKCEKDCTLPNVRKSMVLILKELIWRITCIFRDRSNWSATDGDSERVPYHALSTAVASEGCDASQEERGGI
jgi:hypothetical protein